MPPTPKTATVMEQQKLYSRTFPTTPDDDIVITGISGKFPNSRNMAAFESNLYNKVRVPFDFCDIFKIFGVKLVREASDKSTLCS